MRTEDLIDGDFFESLADLSFGDPYGACIPLTYESLNLFLENFPLQRHPVIYINSDRVMDLFLLATKIKKEFVLISHNGDFNFEPRHLGFKPPCITKWYGQNINIPNSDAVMSIPIGLERKRWFPEIGKQQMLIEYSSRVKDPKQLLYINHNPNTNVSTRGWIHEHFKDKNFATIKLSGNGNDYGSYLGDILDCHYTLCPNGNGIDCHRQWEVLYLNRFPVLERNASHTNVYGDLPVLLVDSFKDVTRELLQSNLETLQKKVDSSKLTRDYYKRLMCF